MQSIQTSSPSSCGQTGDSLFWNRQHKQPCRSRPARNRVIEILLGPFQHTPIKSHQTQESSQQGDPDGEEDDPLHHEEESLAPFLGVLKSAAEPETVVLSKALMKALQQHLPYSKQFENFWLKYSLVRDGAFLPRMLEQVRASNHTLMVIETVDGEVFGSFTGTRWKPAFEYSGSGESFLWRRSSEEEVQVFPFTGANNFVQLCQQDWIVVGGGSPSLHLGTSRIFKIPPHEWGAGLCIAGDLLKGTSSRCATFNSPSLSSAHSDGSLFQIANLEMWTFTPCIDLEQANIMELKRLHR